MASPAPFYDQAKKLLYQNVVVITNIKRRKDFSCQFSPQIVDEASIRHYGETLFFTGYLKAIDPISHSVILCHLGKDMSIADNILILGKTICAVRSPFKKDLNEPESIQNIVEATQETYLSRHPYFSKQDVGSTLTPEELVSLQEKIVGYFNKYRIPIKVDEESQELIVADCVRIKPPYENESNFICPTRVILKRIKHIVDMSKQEGNL